MFEKTVDDVDMSRIDIDITEIDHDAPIVFQGLFDDDREMDVVTETEILVADVDALENEVRLARTDYSNKLIGRETSDLIAEADEVEIFQM